jgi:sugar-phosphatase
MDGVLINSTGADERAWMKWAGFHGMQDSFPIHSVHGQRAVDTIRAVRPDLDVTVEKKRVEMFDAESSEGIVILPGVRNLLAGIPQQRWSIVTSASESLMRRRLESVGIAVPLLVVSADQVSRGKPDPEPYRLGAAQLGLDPTDCLVLEDAPNGVLAGKRAGCQVLAVTSSHNAAELIGANWIVDSLDRVRITIEEDGWLRFEFEAVAI